MAVTYVLFSVFFLALTQVGLALVCVFDAARHKRQNVGQYLLAVFLVPIVSIVVALVYLSRREEFPQRDVLSPEIAHVTPGTGCEIQQSGDRVRWNVQLRGWQNFPRRLSYAFAYERSVWLVMSFSSALLVLAVVASDRGIGFASVAIMGAIWLTYLSDARKFTNTTVELDTESGTIGVTVHGGDSPLLPGYGALTGSAEDIEPGMLETVEIVQVGEQCVAWFEYDDDTDLSPPDMLPVPAEQVEQFRDTVEREGVSVRDRTTDDASDQAIRRRIYATVVTVIVVPFCAVVLGLVLAR